VLSQTPFLTKNRQLAQVVKTTHAAGFSETLAWLILPFIFSNRGLRVVKTFQLPAGGGRLPGFSGVRDKGRKTRDAV
jgi:hypothetical protein